MRREYGGAVPRAALTVALGGTGADLTIICDDLTGWPLGTNPFFIIVNRGKPTEEKMLASVRTGNVITVLNRAVDGTAISAHDMGEYIEHVFTATDADEANEHVNMGSTAHGYPPISDVVTLTGTQTLTNKTMDGDLNTFTDIPQASIVGLTADLAAKTTDLNNHAADTSTHGVASAIVGTSETQTLTNKTIDYTLNTITNLPVTPGPAGPAGPAGVDGPPGEIIYQPTAPVSPTDGMVWVDSDNVVAGVNTLGALSDVDLTGLVDGNALVYELATDTWVPGAGGGGGGGGATGGGTNQVFYENDQTVTDNYTLTAGKNAMTAGPVTINSGITVTVPSGATWTVV